MPKILTLTLWSILLIQLGLFHHPALAQTPQPSGSEFILDSDLNDGFRTLEYPNVVARPNGDFLVVYQKGIDLWGNFLSPNGELVAAPFEVGPHPMLTSNEEPSMTMGAGGEFVVSWSEYSAGDQDFSIKGQRFDSTGLSLTDPIPLSANPEAWGVSPSVARHSSGDILTLWYSLFDPSDDEGGIKGALLSSTGTPVTTDFQVNSFTTARQFSPQVASNGDRFLAVWTSLPGPAEDADGASVRGRLIDGDGSLIGDEFLVNQSTTGDQGSPRIAATSDGRFIVVWASESSQGPGDSSPSIQGRIYDPNGASLGGEFQINSYTADLQVTPNIATRDDGSFVVAWRSLTSAGEGFEAQMQAQFFNSLGERVGEELHLGEPTGDSLSRPEVAIGRDGFMMVWTRVEFLDSQWNNEARGRHFLLPCPEGALDCSNLFFDGFESGDTSLWSSTTP